MTRIVVAPEHHSDSSLTQAVRPTASSFLAKLRSREAKPTGVAKKLLAGGRPNLSKDRMNHLTFDIGQAEIAALGTVGQLEMVEAE